MFNLLHLLLVVATQITRSWCLHDTTQTVQPQHQTTHCLIKFLRHFDKIISDFFYLNKHNYNSDILTTY